METMPGMCLEISKKKAFRPCVWMQAGVVRKKACEKDFRCDACRFDRVMRRVSEENDTLWRTGKVPSGKRGRIIPWKQKMMEYPRWKRPCIHHMKDRIEFRACTHDYRCATCEFDQFFHDQYMVHAVVHPVNVMEVQGFKMPQGYYVHPGHTWAKIEEGSSVRVGIDDFALRLMGPVDTVEAPLLGKEVRQGHGDIRVSRGPHRASLVSPISGVVTAVNPNIREQGRAANKDPFSEGWVMTVHPTDLRRDLKNLMMNTETSAFLESEAGRLYDLIEETAGPLATDGGYLGHDIFGSMPELGWDRLTRLFLKTP